MPWAVTSPHRGPRKQQRQQGAWVLVGIAIEDGMTERWRQPCWEVPCRDPAKPRPNAPDVQQRT
jgi:hypothetical protein